MNIRVDFFLSFIHMCIVVGDPIIEVWAGILLSDLTPSHFVPIASQDTDLSRVVFLFCVFNDLRWKVIFVEFTEAVVLN
jgi:hypothetical protein